MREDTNPTFTEHEARGKLCPAARAGDTLETCRASGCMAWLWSDAPPKLQEPRYEYADFDDDKALLAATKKEPKRPDEVPADWRWSPVILETAHSKDDWEFSGGYWTEPAERAERENAEALAKRRGYCGLVRLRT